MLDWFKRSAKPAPNQSVRTETGAGISDAQVERLVTRLDGSRKPAIEIPTGLTRMRVIVVASQKGGVGKTTVAAHLAVSATKMGQGPSVLVDTDPQGSLTAWWEARRDSGLSEGTGGEGVAPALVSIKLDDLHGQLLELQGKGNAIAIIDTPPALTTSIEEAMATADLVVIPARPSPHDLRAVGATVKITRRAQKPFIFVVNGAAPRANITAEAVAALSEHGRVAPIVLYQRTDYAASMIDGRTVLEMGPSRSSREISELWKQISQQLSVQAAA